MSSVPIMPLNVEEFFADPNVEDMDGEQRAMWMQLCAKAWQRKTLLPADDASLARLMGVGLKRWRSYYKPVFAPLMVAEELEKNRRSFGSFLRIKKVNAVWDQVADRIEKNKTFAAHARAAKAAKAGKAPSVAEPKNTSAPASVPVSAPAPAPETDPSLHQNQDKKGRDAAHPQAGRLALSQAPIIDAAALPPRVNGHVERSASAGSPSLKGGSPAKPSEALLRSKLVNARLDDDDDEPARPSASGLFGALEAAIRGKAEED